MVGSAKILVITLSFARQQGVKRMMKIVAPLGIDVEASLFRRPDEARIVQIALGDQITFASALVAKGSDPFRQFPQKRLRAKVVDGVDGIEPQSVDMILTQPVEGILDKILPHAIAIRHHRS